MKMTTTVRSSTCSSRPVSATIASEVSRPSVIALNTITPTIDRWNALDSISWTACSRLVMAPPRPGNDHWTLRDRARPGEQARLRPAQQWESITVMTVLSRRTSYRFARQFGAAVDRLADSRQSGRVGALHALAMLGQDAPEHRLAIVDVICAYLRSPGTDGPVRLAAVQILARRLHPARREFWPGMSLDLTGAVLTELDLSDCRVDGRLRLDGALLSGQTRLRGLVVGGKATFRGARWAEHAWLERTVFHGPVSFDGATFCGDAWFGEAAFDGWTSFAGTDFGGQAWFGTVSFNAPV